MDNNKEALNFQAKLKDIYKTQDKIAPLIEGLDKIPQQSMKDYYVKLQTIIKEDNDKKHGNYEEISGEKKKIELRDLFIKEANDNSDKEPQKLLILGGAGVGKTTILQYIAYKWSIGELWADKFDYIYRASLKSLLNPQWTSSPWAYEPHQRNHSLLKCLIHHTLCLNLSYGEIKKLIPPERLPWGENKRILLLLDGYDEIAHLANDDDYKRIEEEIFEHDYVIMTSRPNAVNNMLKEKFDRKLENMGLDDSGIEQYFRQYFRDTPQKGADLDSFLSGNPVIKSICKIPVNIAMLCYIWSESESSAKLNEISRVSSLYQEVVSQLGRRYFAKQYKGEKAEGYRLEEKLENGQFILDELKVLTYTAYNSMTGGGLRASDDGSAETLIIRGCLENQKDERGISIQSSINFLASQGLLHDDQRRKTTVTDVFKYGLLKVEGAVASSSNAKSGPDFLNQTYSFIHLTFQECLTANYLKELLKKGTEQEKSEVCGYIADRRNEPRYLMTLKFMAGIITDEANPEDPEHKLQTMFWDAMTCNIDGLIELGIETKVSLLMHLLSQAKAGGAIDPRIPHNQDIVNLIDAVVLSDLGNWINQLRESDYMSENIKEGIITGLVGDYVQWYSGKIQQIQAKSSPELQAAIKILVEAKRSKEEDKKNKQGAQIENSMISAMERVSMFYVKLNLKELHAVMEKLETIISQYKTQEWQLVRKALEVFTRLFETVKKGLKSSDEGFICIQNLSELISDSNFAGYAQEAIYTVFIATVEKKEENKIDRDYLIGAMFNLLDIIPSVNENIKASIFEVMNDIRKALEGNKESGERARKTILRILEETDSSVADIVYRLIAAVRCLYLILKDEEELAQSVEEISKFFQRYPEKQISEEVAQTLDEISRATTNQKIKEAALQKLQEWACDNTDWKDYWVLRLKCFLLAEQNSPAGIVELTELLFKEIISASENEALNNKMIVFKDLIESPRYSQLELALSQKIFSTISPKENITINKTKLRYIFIMICDNVLKHQDRKNEFCKQFISLLSVDDAELLSLILNTLSESILYNRFDYNTNVCLFEKLTALLSHKDKRVKMNAIKSMGAMNSHFKHHPQLQSRFGLSVLANIASLLSDHDEEILTNAIENIDNGFSFTYFGDDRSTYNEEEREFLIQFLDKIAKLLSHNNITIQQKASSVLSQMAIKFMTDETVRKHTFTIVSNYFSSEGESVRINSVHTARVILDEGLDSDLDALFLKNTKELLSTDYRVACTALRVLLRSIKKAGGKDLAPQMFLDAVDIIKNLDQSGIGHSFSTILESQDTELIALISEPLLNFRNDGDVYKDRIYMLMGVVKKTKDKDLATRVVNKMTNFLTNQDEMAEVFFHCISEVIEFMQDKKLAADLYKQFFIASDQHFQFKVIGSISKLLFSAQDKQLVAQAFKLLSKILSDRVAEIKSANNPEQSSNCLREINNCAKAIYNIVLCFKDKEVTSQGLKDLLILLEELPEKGQEETISLISDITTKYFLVPSEDILKCLRHPLYSLSSRIEESLTKSFEYLLQLISSVEKAVKDTQDIDTNSLQRIKDSLMPVSTRMFRHRLHAPRSEIFRETIGKIKENINTLQNSKSTAEDVIKFKESVIPTLNKAMTGHELIEIALVVIGYQESGIQNQELIELSRKILNLQIKCLDDQGLKWINSNVETLATLSGESKLFFKRLYHKLLQDKVITPLEKTLIIKLINQGLTTSISRKGEIILEGKKYVIEGENIMSILEEIARAVIEQEKDVLGIQYRTHIPIFAKSVSSGIKKASSDIRAVYSVVDKSHKLSSDGWLLTKLADNSEEMAIVVEQRSAIGDHLVFQVKKKKMMRIIPGGKTTKTELEDIFGKHTSLGRKYSGSSILLTNQEATQLINGQSLDYSSRISKAQAKSYFLDELLGQGNQDRLAYLEEELASKLTDHEKGVTSALKKSGITPEDRAKLKDYYKAFIGTFASTYTTSQVVDSGQVTLNAGDTAATLLSTLASFAPFIGNTLSSSITSIAEFLKSQEMLKSARKMKNLASDTVSLNQLIGECAYQVVLNTKKQKEILSITDEELQKISGSVIEKITKFCGNMGEKVDEYLYGRMYSTAAAKLGNNDANKVIQAWIKDDMNLERIQEQFIKIATGEKSKESPSPSKAKENDETESKRSSCCQLF